MVIFVNEHADAWHRHGADRGHDRGEAPPRLSRGRGCVAACLIGLATFLSPVVSCADTLRIATFNTELARKGPGLLLRDVVRGKDDQIAAVLQVIAAARADVLVLQSIDWDLELRALGALNAALAPMMDPYPHILALQPNTGIATGLDMDGDGRLGRSGDAQGFGAFVGQGGMAILTRLPIDRAGVVDLSPTLWRDVPDVSLPEHPDGRPFPSREAQALQRLSQTAHWDVPLVLPDGSRLHILTFHAAPPVFDGPEDRNGLRNAAEIGLWRQYLDGKLSYPAPAGPVIVAGDANLDPEDGDGLKPAIRALLRDARLQDPMPLSVGGAQAAAAQGRVNRTQIANPAYDTVDWPDEPGGPGNLRVSYILPQAGITLGEAGILWPDATQGDDLAAAVSAASRHRLVWVDLVIDGAGQSLNKGHMVKVGQ